MWFKHPNKSRLVNLLLDILNTLFFFASVTPSTHDIYSCRDRNTSSQVECTEEGTKLTIPRAGLHPVDGIDKGSGSPVTGVGGVNAFHVCVAGLLEELHQTTLNTL